MSDEQRLPPPPQNLPIRPLTRGLRLDVPAQLADPGSLVDARNYIVSLGGLRRRPQINRFSSTNVRDDAVGTPNPTVIYQPIQDLLSVWSTGGTQTTLIVGDKFIYRATPAAVTGIYSKYVTGTVSGTASTSTVTGSGTLWLTAASDVRTGDVIVLDADNSAGAYEERVVATIASNTSLTTETPLANTHPGGTDYVIRRAFDANLPYMVDWTIVGPSQEQGGSLQTASFVVFTDNIRDVFAYNVVSGAYTNAYLQDTTPIVCATVEFFGQRLWAGHVTEGSIELRQRIRWTSPLNRTRFDLTQPQTGYVDLTETQGAVRKLMSMGPLLVAYMQDSIYIGRLTNNLTYPVKFERIETNGVGLAGLKAVARFMGGHFFVGQDNIYFLTPRGIIEPIGTPIVERAIREASSLVRSYATTDPSNDRVVFGMQKDGEDMQEVFSFNYKTKTWAYDQIPTTILSNAGNSPDITWDTLSSAITPDTWDQGMSVFSSWDGIENLDPGEKNLFFAQTGIVYILGRDGGADAAGGVIVSRFETTDLDFERPDRRKMFNRVSLKLSKNAEEAINFEVDGSTNRGATYKSLGAIRIPVGADEGYLNFRITGSIVRFRFTHAEVTNPFEVSEVVLRGRLGGLETK